MGRHKIDIKVHSAADPATLYALLRDGRTWPDWSPLGTFELRHPGDGGAEGIGAIRVFHSRFRGIRSRTTEQVVELVPDRRFSYALLAGMPLKGYRADVDLVPADEGTTIHWHSTFDAKVPGTGWIYQRMLTDFLRQCAEGLATHAARPTATKSE